MRVCFVAFQFWPSVGGTQSQAAKQARYMRKLGQDVMVVTLRHQKSWFAREEYFQVPVVRVGGLYKHNGTLRVGRFAHLFLDILVFLTLLRLRQQYDLIHTFQFSPLAAVAALVGKLTRKPVIIGVQSPGPYECFHDDCQPSAPQRVSTVPLDASQMHCLEQQENAAGDIACLQKQVWGGTRMLEYLRKSDAYYQVLSSRSYTYLLQHGFRSERIVYIPNGVDTQQFYPLTWQGETEFSTERVVISVARLEYAKGIDVLLQAWAQMLNMPAWWRSDLQPKLWLVGDGQMRDELERMAHELGIRDSVAFLGTRLDIPWLLQEAWGFVLPSRWEGMPNALLEAMACALPCIATQVSGSEDVIEQGVNGLLVTPEHPESLAYALRLLIEDTSLARKLGWSGYETVLRYYPLHSTVQSCLTFYSYLLNNAREHAHDDLAGYSPASNIYPEEWQRYE